MQHSANKMAKPHGLCLDIVPIIIALNAALPNCNAPMTPDAAPAAFGCDEIANAIPNGNKKPLPKVRIEMAIKLVRSGHGLTYICIANNMPPITKITYPR